MLHFLGILSLKVGNLNLKFEEHVLFSSFRHLPRRACVYRIAAILLKVIAAILLLPLNRYLTLKVYIFIPI